MKNFCRIAFSLACLISLFVSAEDNSKMVIIHLTSSHQVYGGYFELTSIVEGRKELLYDIPGGISHFPASAIKPGDYPARIVHEKETNGVMVERTYEVKFPDGTTKHWKLLGLSE